MKLLLRLQVTVWELIMIMIITHQRAVVADMETDIIHQHQGKYNRCLLYTSPSPRDGLLSRMPSSA